LESNKIGIVEMIYRLRKHSIYLEIIFYIYIIAIFLKKIFPFQSGILDVLILSLLIFFLLLRPKKLWQGLRKLLTKTVFILFLIFTFYYIGLSFISFNSNYLIVLEYLSVLKWILYFFIGYLFAYVYDLLEEDFPQKNSLLFFTIIILIYSISFYNWSGLEGPSTLFGFYSNSYESIFSLRSIFALFGFIVFIYGINIYDRYKYSGLFFVFSSFIFLFMSGNRKMLIAYFLVILFIKFNTKYRKILKFFKILLLFIIALLLLQSTMYKKSIKEYSNDKQPRVFTYLKSFQIASDYFPFGSGPATFASKGSMVNYSPIYKKYNMNKKWGFGQNDKVHFYNDTYWAQIIGQYGVIGVLLLLLIYLKIAGLFRKDNNRIRYRIILFILLFISIVTPALQRIEISLFLFFVLGMKLRMIERKNGFKK